MAGSTAASDDRLPTQFHDNNGLATLRFEGGDVVIKMPASPNAWLLVHKAALAATSIWFKSAFNPRWQKPETIRIEDTGEEVELHSLAINVVDSTYMLEGKDLVTVDDGNSIISIHKSTELAPKGWPEEYEVGTAIGDDIISLMIGILHGLEPTIADLADMAMSSEPLYWPFTLHHAFNNAIALGSYAEYHDCLPKIAPAIGKALRQHARFWREVAEAPEKFLLLAIKLRDVELYFDALRHYIHSTVLAEGGWEDAAELLGETVEELKDKYEAQLDNGRGEIDHFLRRLTLSEASCCRGHNQHTYFTKFLQSDAKRRRGSSNEKMMENIGFITRATFAEWYNNELSEENSKKYKRCKSYSNGRVNLACHRLLLAAKSRNPCNMFAQGTVKTLADRWGFPEGPVRDNLTHIVQCAADFIEQKFREKIVIDFHDDKTITFRSSKYDQASMDYFSHLGVDESDLPWDVVEAVEKDKKLAEGEGEGDGEGEESEGERDEGRRRCQSQTSARFRRVG